MDLKRKQISIVLAAVKDALLCPSFVSEYVLYEKNRYARAKKGQKRERSLT